MNRRYDPFWVDLTAGVVAAILILALCASSVWLFAFFVPSICPRHLAC